MHQINKKYNHTPAVQNANKTRCRALDRVYNYVGHVDRLFVFFERVTVTFDLLTCSVPPATRRQAVSLHLV